eukprot:CAMPEP_0194269908 /NCGR_PEP_ID=MMETSP0169-20130528/4003_1 /TAXON_ID=218684 /ORGANISM="Corethron pennatum, Strain L29A3" /LENGTH=418 /DNA_ID=CAMNT_0039011755 /DNA_START=237 /DNA_END=1490 /DNA_ORIENTATION=+
MEGSKINSAHHAPLGPRRRQALVQTKSSKAEALSLFISKNGGNISDPEADKLIQSDAGGDESSIISSEAACLVMLNLVAVIWGTQHAFIKVMIDDTAGIDASNFASASNFNLARFAVAAVAASPRTPNLRGLGEWLGRENQKPDAKQEMSQAGKSWRYGAELGAYMFAGFAAHAVGLTYTTAQRSGFLLYLNVKIVPFLAAVTLGRRISLLTWASAASAFMGTCMLGYDGSSLNVGDLWSIAAAFTSAVFILRMEAVSRYVPDSAALNAACLWTVVVLCFLWALFVHAIADSPNNFTAGVFIGTWRAFTHHPTGLIYLGAVTTTLCNWMQAQGQRGVAAERASICYAMDPVYGAFFAYLLLGETMGAWGIFGSSIIAFTAAINAFLDLKVAADPDDASGGELYTSVSLSGDGPKLEID